MGTLRARVLAIVVFTALATAVGACGEDAAPFDGLLAPPPDGHGVQLGFSVDLAPGEENVYCKYVALPAGMNVARFEQRFTGTSHHVILYATSIPVAEAPTGISPNCLDAASQRDRVTGLAFASQSEASETAFPAGVGMPLFGGLAMIVEFHVLNTTDQPASAEVAINLWQAQGSLTGEAGILFYYQDLIAVPAGGTAVARKRCPVAADVTLVAALPHMHSRGRTFHAELDRGGAPEVLLDAQGWEADTEHFAPAIEVAAGDVVDFTCTYQNDGPTLIVEGPSATRNEMCVFGAIYYRPGGFRLPVTEEACRSEASIVYTGRATCMETATCSLAIDWNGDADAAWAQYELCRSLACDRAGHVHNALSTCVSDHCFADCTRVAGLTLDDPQCSACVAASCADARSACEAATCP